MMLAMPVPTAAQAPAAGGQKLVPLPIVLPQPMFEGTPQNMKVPNLEKPRYKARDPFLAPAGVVNVARRKKVVSSDVAPVMGDMSMITDGDRTAEEGSEVELGPGRQQVTVDLGAMHEIYAVLFWHFHRTPRVYFDVVVQIADDQAFTRNVRTLFNNDHDNASGLGAGKDMNYVETSEGRLVDAKGSLARYVRLYSNGNSANELNHYIEVEVFGRPVK
ncbi:MAG: hypothetical protein A3G21_01940 [Acidobacteria bacterium RIFCSPLOWO2_12_FULL_66_21]|nr:MAG: hypothetical protein A3G21_01940 [Acidobacteria bacterium RIFCSPLOWO2_12_FULL_66_21]